MRYIAFVVLWIVSYNLTIAAQDEHEVDSKEIVTNSLWDNWYGQIGVDMSLQNPYGSNFTNVFPKGKSYGVDIAVGKCFTLEFGMRAKVNLENVFFQSDHAEWLKRLDKGYITLVEDF